MLFRTESLAPATLQLERLPMDEASSSYIELLPLVESEKLGKKVLSLESALEYSHDSYTDLENVVSKMAELYDLNEEDIVFSIAPASVYFNEEVNNLVRVFLKEGVPFYLSCHMDSFEGQLIAEACSEAERTGSTDYLEALSEGIMDRLKATGNAMKSGAVSGAAIGAAGTAGNVALGGLNSIKTGLKAGFVRGAEDLVDKKGLGRFLDTKEDRYELDPKTGNVERKNVTVTNGRVKNFLKQHVTTDKDVLDMADSMVSSARSQLTGDVVNRAKQALGVVGQNLSPQNLINALSQRISYFGNRIASGKGDPRNRTIFQRIIDKLNDLKDKLIAKFRGH